MTATMDGLLSRLQAVGAQGMLRHVYGKATQQAGISHVLHTLGAHSVVTASPATYLTPHAALALQAASARRLQP